LPNPRIPLVLLSLVAIVACREGTPRMPGGTGAAHLTPVGAVAPQLPLTVAPGVTVTRVAFGIITTAPDGEERFVETHDVPAVDGQVFGWVAEVQTDRRSVRFEEHLRLPAPPASWGDAENDPDVLISNDGRSALARGEEAVEGGTVSRFFWSLADGDPAGEYELEVEIEGRTVGHFKFRVPVAVREGAMIVRLDHAHSPAAVAAAGRPG
jgi:hypothetical protein